MRSSPPSEKLVKAITTLAAGTLRTIASGPRWRWGKLMGLNQDQLANALSLALVPHMPMYVCHIGTQSMWKGPHSSEQVRNGVWAAMLARAGMTGPCVPFAGRGG